MWFFAHFDSFLLTLYHILPHLSSVFSLFLWNFVVFILRFCGFNPHNPTFFERNVVFVLDFQQKTTRKGRLP